MNEKRSAYRRRVLKTGRIITSDKAPTIQCTIRNATDTGAALQVSTSFGIPGSFDVIIEGARRRCRSLWRTDTIIGVSFEQASRPSALGRRAMFALPSKADMDRHSPDASNVIGLSTGSPDLCAGAFGKLRDAPA
jgi:hypothetical protein